MNSESLFKKETNPELIDYQIAFYIIYKHLMKLTDFRTLELTANSKFGQHISENLYWTDSGIDSMAVSFKLLKKQIHQINNSYF